jgi:DNA-binding SARP family transcriptional activator
LWCDSPPTQSKKYLRQTLWQLQTALTCQTEPVNGRLLLVEPNWIQLNTVADLWLDVALFEQAFNLVQRVPGNELELEQVRSLESAVDLHKGELLSGWYQAWCLDERERFRHMYMAMLDKLMGHYEAHHKYETGLAYGERLLQHDRARERTHRRMMRLYYLAGDRTLALGQYQRCIDILAEELDVKPSKRTQALYEQIRADQLEDPFSTPIKRSALSGMPPTPLSETLDQLKQLVLTLPTVLHQLEKVIQLVERATNDQR